MNRRSQEHSYWERSRKNRSCELSYHEHSKERLKNCSCERSYHECSKQCVDTTEVNLFTVNASWAEFLRLPHSIERVEIVIRALSAISQTLRSRTGDLDGNLNEFRSSIDVIWNCCQSLRLLWQAKVDTVEDHLGIAQNNGSVPRVWICMAT